MGKCSGPDRCSAPTPHPVNRLPFPSLLLVLLTLTACDAAQPAPEPPPLTSPNERSSLPEPRSPGTRSSAWRAALSSEAGDLHFAPVRMPEGSSLTATLVAPPSRPDQLANGAASPAAYGSAEQATIGLVCRRVGEHYEVRLAGGDLGGRTLQEAEPVYVPAGDHRLLPLPVAGPSRDGGPTLLATRGPRSVHFTRDGDGNTIIVFDYARSGASLVGTGLTASHLGFRIPTALGDSAWAELEVRSPEPLGIYSWHESTEERADR